MRPRAFVVILWALLSVILLPLVDFCGLHPFSVLSSIGYEPWISRYFGMASLDLLWPSLFMSALLFTTLSALLQRTYNRRSKRLLSMAAPLLTALFAHYLIVLQVDALPHDRHFLEFMKTFFADLPYFVLGYVGLVGTILFLLILITCYPAGVLVDYVLVCAISTSSCSSGTGVGWRSKT